MYFSQVVKNFKYTGSVFIKYWADVMQRLLCLFIIFDVNFMQVFQLTCFSAWFSRFSARHSSPFPTLVGAKTIGPSSFASANPRRRKLMSSLLPSCESSASVSRAFRVLQTKQKKEIISTRNVLYRDCDGSIQNYA
jgi:hypothetical protein